MYEMVSFISSYICKVIMNIIHRFTTVNDFGNNKY